MRIVAVAILLVLVSIGADTVRADECRVLVVHDEFPEAEVSDQWVVSSLLSLLGHFDCATTVIPAEEYGAGEIDRHDAVIYLGLWRGAELSPELLTDIYDTDRTVCWVGHNLDQLAERFSLGRYGFHLSGGEPATGYDRVFYRGQLLARGAGPLTRIAVTDAEACEVLATAEGAGRRAPYAVRSGRFWYFADLPLLQSSEIGHYLVLCDQLHEVLIQPHQERRTAFICITGVNAESDPHALRSLIRYLQGESLPFAISVIPVFRDPAEGVEIRLSSRGVLVGVLRGAQRGGAAVIAEGFTHQRLGRSGQEAEFWDLRRDRPAADRSVEDTRMRLERSVAELLLCGLFPVAWSTPDGRASPEDYEEIARYYSTVWERRLPGALAREAQMFPFLIERDRHGQRILPENLMVVGRNGAEVESALEQARNLSAVTDPWISASLAPDAPVEAVKLLLGGLGEMGCEFADVRRMDNWAQAEDIEIHSSATPRSVEEVIPEGWDGTLMGPGRRELERFERAGRDRRDRSFLRPGAILIAYPHGLRPEQVFALEGGPQDAAHRAVGRITYLAVIFAVIMCLVLIVIYVVQVSLQRWA